MNLSSLEGFLFIFCLLLFGIRSQEEPEEFRLTEPSAIDDAGVKEWMEMRQADPEARGNLTWDNPLMKTAAMYASGRVDHPGVIDDGHLTGSEDSQVINALPRPDSDLSTGDKAIAESITEGNSNYALMSKEQLHAAAVEIGENIGQGAIAKVGAMALGNEGQWIKYVEDGLKRKNKLLHGEMIWHLGQKRIENRTMVEGLLNRTKEREIFDNLMTWAKEGGASLAYIEPVWIPEQGGFRLVATETIGSDEPVLQLPMKLMMSRVTARNVRIKKTNRYVADQLKSTFQRNEKWALAVFVLHEWFKEHKGHGSKWGPLLRSMHVRQFSSQVTQHLANTQVLPVFRKWKEDGKDLEAWTKESDGPCFGTTGMCDTKPMEKVHRGKFDHYHLRWALEFVEQNAVKVRQKATGQSFLAIMPFMAYMDRRVDGRGGAGLELDGSLTLSTGVRIEERQVLSTHCGFNYTDQEFFARYMRLPVRARTQTDEAMSMLEEHKRRRARVTVDGAASPSLDEGGASASYVLNPTLMDNPHNFVKLVLPGVISYDHILYKCLHRINETAHDECPVHKLTSASMTWKFAELGRWRRELNLPGRLSDIRSAAMQLHLYGDSPEEADRLSKANTLIRQLPVSTETIDPETQLMMLGMAADIEEATEMIKKAAPKKSDGDIAGPIVATALDGSSEAVRPQLYDAPDPEEDDMAKMQMERLAMLAAQTQRSVLMGNAVYNATQEVVNQTQAFFQDGILPPVGLDALDRLLMKKIGMLFHCGSDADMRIQYRNISDGLWCAMRVHLMNESEINVFCPEKYEVFHEACQQVSFSNFTAISPENERNVISAFRESISSMISAYPSTEDEDRAILKDVSYDEHTKQAKDGSFRMGPILTNAVHVRLREKMMLSETLKGLTVYETEMEEGAIEYQLERKRQERLDQDRLLAAREAMVAEVKKRANASHPLLVLPVDLEGQSSEKRANLTLLPGQKLSDTVMAFCAKHGVAADGAQALEKVLRTRVASLPRVPPNLLTVGVIGTTGDRHVLGIVVNANYTIETNIFCDRYGLSGLGMGMVEMRGVSKEPMSECERLQALVRRRLLDEHRDYSRPPLVEVPLDSPDGRTLTLVIYEGEQHNLLQTVADFLQFHNILTVPPLPVAEAVNLRLPNPILTLPVALDKQRTVMMRVCDGDNVTNVVHAFADMYNVPHAIDQLKRMAVNGMHPGSFLV